MQPTEPGERATISIIERIADDMFVQDLERKVYSDDRGIVVTVKRDGKEISTGFSTFSIYSASHLSEKAIRAQMVRVAMALGASLFIQPGKDGSW